MGTNKKSVFCLSDLFYTYICLITLAQNQGKIQVEWHIK
jgi:hypothetical protein